MTIQEMLEQIGGVAGLQQYVLKRHPNPSNSVDALPQARQTFEKFLAEVKYIASVKDLSTDDFLRKPSSEFELRHLLELGGLLTVNSYESKTGKRRGIDYE